MKNYRVLCFLFLSSALSARAATELESGEIFVDLRESPRVARASEPLAYSTRWAGADALVGCTRKARLAVAGYAGAETLEGVPVLVRLSTAIQGFDYDDFAAPATGADLVFCDDAETTVYPHEIDEWNTNGESLVWVRLPALAAGAAFKMGYGGTPATAADVAATAHAVWSDYAGVWHMNEDSGTAFDSTANGLDAVPTFGDEGDSATLSQMVATNQGAVGRARVNATEPVYQCLRVPSYDDLHLGSTFVASGWFHGDVEEQYWPKIFWRDWSSGGWGAEFRNNTMSEINVIGGFSGSQPYLRQASLARSAAQDWTWICLAYQGTTVALYQDGEFLTNGTIVAVSDNGSELQFGSKLVGQYDEIRLRGGSLSAARIRADYDMIANPGFVTCGAVEAASEVAVEIRLDGEVFAGPFAGEGTASWTPAKPGIYEFEHVSLVDGTPVATESASFVVPDPADDDLSIVAEGDLVEGVSVRLGGAPDGWTLHYTTNGSNPTAESPVYTGPFVLGESATVKVVAVSDAHGWTSGVAEQRFDLAPPLAVNGARARQRYPWNGLVDVDFTLEGDTARRYRVSLEATDLAGGTNLALRTVWEDGGALTNAALDVAPGAHRFVWNADADLPAGFVADQMAIDVRAEAIHDTALYMVVDLSGGPDAERYPVSYLPDVPEGGWTDEYKTDKLVLRRVEPGWFTMGTRETDYLGATNTQRNVILTQPYYASVFEMTQRQWQKISGDDPSMYLGDVRPVDRATYDMVRGSNLGTNWPTSFLVDDSSLIGSLRRRVSGALFDLPTSAQWEYACRAGTVTALNSNKDILSTGGDCPNAAEVGRYCGNSGWLWNSTQKDRVPYGEYDERGGHDRSSNVGSYLPNRWGLYDMHGNVWEWCLDWQSSAQGSDGIDPKGSASGERRIIRGGAWDSLAIGLPSGNGGESRNVDNDSVVMGFRLFLHDASVVVAAPIVAPAGLAATTNRTGDVMLSWEPVAGAYAYQIRRSKTGAFEDGTWLNTVTNTTYADWTAEAGADYAYWVRAQFESGKVGRWSEGAEGKRLPGTYTVRYNANGGSGTMADQVFIYDEAQQLRAKSFTRNKYRFVGWARSSSGSVQYADKETVINLGGPNETVILYAIWTENSLGEGIDQPDLIWTTSSNYPWVYYTREWWDEKYYYTYDKIDGVKSTNPFSTVAVTWLQTTITGPATFSFRYAPRHPAGHTFSVIIDGTTVYSDSKATDRNKLISEWIQKSFSVGSGAHTIQFRYQSIANGYANDGGNAIRLDTMTVTYQ